MSSRPRSEARFDQHAVTMHGVVTIYDDFHEHAHLEQASRRTLAWRAYELFTRHPVLRWSGLGLLAVMALELEALTIASRGMKACGLWDEEAQREAADGFGSYVDKLLGEWW